MKKFDTSIEDFSFRVMFAVSFIFLLLVEFKCVLDQWVEPFFSSPIRT